MRRRPEAGVDIAGALGGGEPAPEPAAAVARIASPLQPSSPLEKLQCATEDVVAASLQAASMEQQLSAMRERLRKAGIQMQGVPGAAPHPRGDPTQQRSRSSPETRVAQSLTAPMEAAADTSAVEGLKRELAASEASRMNCIGQLEGARKSLDERGRRCQSLEVELEALQVKNEAAQSEADAKLEQAHAELKAVRATVAESGRQERSAIDTGQVADERKAWEAKEAALVAEALSISTRADRLEDELASLRTAHEEAAAAASLTATATTSSNDAKAEAAALCAKMAEKESQLEHTQQLLEEEKDINELHDKTHGVLRDALAKAQAGAQVAEAKLRRAMEQSLRWKMAATTAGSHNGHLQRKEGGAIGAASFSLLQQLSVLWS